MRPAEHLPLVHRHAHELALIPAPRDVDALDVVTSVAAQKEALRIAGALQGIVSSYINVAPLPNGEDSRKLPDGYVEVASLAESLLARAYWLNHAWLYNQYGIRNERPEPPVVRA